MDRDENSADSATTNGDETDITPFSSQETLPTSHLESTDRLEYCSELDTYRTEFDMQCDAPSEVVIQSIAAVVDQSPLALKSLYDVIDPDALDTGMASPIQKRGTGDVHVTFTFHGHDVTLHSYGLIDVAPDRAESASD